MEQIALTQDREKAKVQSVLLLTDGLANQGITSREGILEQMRNIQDLGLGAVALTEARPVSQGFLSGLQNWFSGRGSAAATASKDAKVSPLMTTLTLMTSATSFVVLPTV